MKQQTISMPFIERLQMYNFAKERLQEWMDLEEQARPIDDIHEDMLPIWAVVASTPIAMATSLLMVMSGNNSTVIRLRQAYDQITMVVSAEWTKSLKDTYFSEYGSSPKNDVVSNISVLLLLPILNGLYLQYRQSSVATEKTPPEAAPPLQ